MPVELSDEMRAIMVLSLVPGVGPRTTMALLETFESASRVLHASVSELQAIPRIGGKLAQAISKAKETVDLDRELQLVQKHRVDLLPLNDPEYPGDLKHIPSAPPILYVRGKLLPEDAKAVGIVGSRNCTDYGRRMARRLAGELAREGYTVISGLARGIDGESHRGALRGGGRTLAVLAGGLSKIYPPEHKPLSEEVERQGALITEATMSQSPVPEMFPARNRIISGMSQAVVIVEAALKSGALITAHHAADQGKTVLAVPGPVDEPASEGTNDLIRQGATLCRGVCDILEELEGISAAVIHEQSAPAKPLKPSGPPPGLDADQLRIWESLEEGPALVDDLVEKLGIAAAKLSGMLLMMEMKKIVSRLPGNRYEQARN